MPPKLKPKIDLQQVDDLRLPAQQVSAVVVNYNGGDLLIKCVEVLLKQASQVIVVDNRSNDHSMEQLRAVHGEAAGLQLVFSDLNRGFASGCNLGLRFAAFENVLFINPDCILGENALYKLVAALDEHAGAGMAGGLLTNPDGSEQGGGRRAVPTPWRSFVRAFGLNRLGRIWPNLFFDFYLHNQPLPPRPIHVEAISGALMLVRRQAILDVGEWDEAYFLHCEDLDWCMRFRQKKWEILFVPDALVVHYQGGSSRSRPLWVEWHKHKGMLRFYSKFFRHRYPGILMWLVRFGVWLRFALVASRYWTLRIWMHLR